MTTHRHRTTRHTVLALAGSIGALLAGHSAQAATLFYDGGNVNIGTNGNGASGGTAGTWSTAIEIGRAHV